MRFSFAYLLFALFNLGIASNRVHIIRAPYHVQVETADKKFLCSGTIVHYKWLVTTASCIKEGIQNKDVRVRSGSALLTQYGGVHYIRGIHRHPEYNPQTNKYSHDLALIQLWYHFVLSCTVYPMRMPTSHTFPEQPAYYSTWFNNKTHGAQLSMVNTAVYDREQCAKYFKDLPNDTACLKRLEESCVEEGDPVLIDGSVQGFLQQGGCTENSPLVLTDLVGYLDWIKQTIQKYTKHAKGEQPPKSDPCPWRQYALIQLK